MLAIAQLVRVPHLRDGSMVVGSNPIGKERKYCINIINGGHSSVG